jgi:adenylate cyclase
VLFADVRGYTKLTAGLSAAEVPVLVNRFYETASKALLSHQGLLGQIEGDNVMSIFVPGLAGSEYQANAVEAGRSLLQAVGPGTELSLEVGVGISTRDHAVQPRPSGTPTAGPFEGGRSVRGSTRDLP